MNDIFQDLIAQGVVCVYLDDILIYTKTIEEHRMIVHKVMNRLQDYKLYLYPEKLRNERERDGYYQGRRHHPPGHVHLHPVEP